MWWVLSRTVLPPRSHVGWRCWHHTIDGFVGTGTGNTTQLPNPIPILGTWFALVSLKRWPKSVILAVVARKTI